jgi:hypothetical protein
MRGVIRRWRAWILGLAAVTGLCSLSLLFLSHPTARASDGNDASPSTQPANVLDASSYSRVRELRGKLCLSDIDLAAMGLSSEAAQGIVQALVNWYQQNSAADSALEQQIIVTLRGRAELTRLANLGSSGADAAAQWQANDDQLKQLLAQRKQLDDSATAAVGSLLPSDAVAVWNAARANAGWPEMLRYVPDLTRDQASRIQDILIKRAQGLLTEQDASQQVGLVVTGSQSAASEAAWSRARLSAGATAGATSQVLPVPDVLQEHTSNTLQGGGRSLPGGG